MMETEQPAPPVEDPIDETAGTDDVPETPEDPTGEPPEAA